jgi:hypothetical protein
MHELDALSQNEVLKCQPRRCQKTLHTRSSFLYEWSTKKKQNEQKGHLEQLLIYKDNKKCV